MELDKIELFSSLNNAEIKHISSIARRVHLARGEPVFIEGDYEKNIYIIETGQVEIFKKTPLNGEQTIALMKNGDYFGEMAFFEKASTRSASARTLQTTSLIVIEGPDFEKLIHDNPSISLKLLSTLSHRLRETNRLITSTGPVNQSARAGSQNRECQFLTVAGAKDGYGKTTFATSLARMLAVELNRKVLFLDMDLYYGGGTHLLGVHSPRSIIDIINRFRQNESNFSLLPESIKLADNLYSIPAPRSFLEAEQVHAPDLVKLLKEARKHFDYVITDTGSIFDENLYTVLDTSDHIFFIINFTNLATVTDNVRFFHGISKLSYPRERLILLGNNVAPDFSTAKTSRVFPYPVVGGLPRVPDFEPQFGKPVYDVAPNSPYCEILRLLVRNVLKETNLKRPQPVKGGIIASLFGEKDPESAITNQLMQLKPVAGSSFVPIISAGDVRSQIKYVRYNLLFGYLEEAKRNLLSFMEFSQSSAPLCELLGEIFLKEEKKAEALEAFQRAISLDPKQHVALGYLGHLSGVKDKFDQAVAAVKEKIAANPRFLDLRNDYAKILISNENYEEATVQLDAALKENPNYLEARLNLALCLSRLGEADRAIIMLLNVENKNPRLFFTLGEIFYATGRLYLAYRAFSKAAGLYPAYPGLQPKLAELSGYIRKLETVIDLHERFVNTSPTFPDLHSKLATFYQLAGKTELATAHYKKAIEINPAYQSAVFKLEQMQKDEISRLAKIHLEETPVDHTDMTPDLRAKITFATGNRKILPEEAVIQVKNVRTSRILQKAVNFSQIDSGSMELDCSPLGLLAPQDILLFQILDVKNASVIRFAPHYLEKDEILANHCDISLDLELKDPTGEIETMTRFFLVHLTSKQMANLIGKGSSFRAILKNASNGLESDGFINPENDEQINFVLNSLKLASDGIPAVKPGDRLSIKVFDGKNEDVFAMEFAIGKTDVQNFCKTIVPQEIS